MMHDFSLGSTYPCAFSPNIFHCSLLETCATRNILNRVVPPPHVVQLVDGVEYEVATILDSKIIPNKLYYMVDWLEYGPNDCTWEPADHVTNAQVLVDASYHKYLAKPSISSLATRNTCRFKKGIVS